MYDRGNIKQVLKAHQIVPVAEYTADAVKLPAPQEIPHIDMEVCNYHHVVLGTFHAKYMVVDRKIALINSNNIQDRVNVEMMVHVEGPIVESFYDMCLLSWANALSPPLPLLANPPPPATDFKFEDDHSHIASKDLDSHKVDAAKTLQTKDYPGDLSLKGGQQDGYDVDYSTEKRNNEEGLHANTGAAGESQEQIREGKLKAITKHLSAYPVRPYSLGSTNRYSRHQPSAGHEGDAPRRRRHGGLQPAHRPQGARSVPDCNGQPQAARLAQLYRHGQPTRHRVARGDEVCEEQGVHVRPRNRHIH